MSGNTLTLERVSPSTTILHVPEKLVLEVRATGHGTVSWWRNGNPPGKGNFNPTIQQFLHFKEIYAKQTTNSFDLGIYLVIAGGPRLSASVAFAVIAPGMSLVSFT